ncbi:MAG: glycosyltransferase family 2 protein [Lysobacterales bacterium]
MVNTGNSPRCSVVIATYNRAPVLAWAIRSVLAQSMSELELLVIGDCCTDESAEVVASFGDSRVHWHNLDKNAGHQYGPNNLGLRLARSAYVAYLGHDDLWLPGHLDALLPSLEDGAAFVHTSLAISIPDSALKRLDRPPWWHRRPWVPPTCSAHPVERALRVGGWPSPADCRSVDPEVQLAWELTRPGGKRVHIPRLTAIKFPAAKRQNCYRDRSALEQGVWWDLIQKSADPEARLAEVVRNNQPPVVPRANTTPPLSGLKRTLERHKAKRRYKGLDSPT